MRAVAQAHRSAGAADFLHGHHVGQVAHVGTAKLLGHGDAQHAQAAHLLPQVHGELVGPVDLGGTGHRFNLGEITVTRCALRIAHIENGAVGVAYVMGRNHRQAQLAAVADALLQDPALHESLALSVLQPVRQHLAQQQSRRAARAQSTKVDFFTVASESGTTDDGDEA